MSGARPLKASAVAAALAAVVLLVWGPLLWAPFVYDDGLFLLANPDMSGPWPGLGHWLTASFGGYHVFEPVNALLHFALWRAFGPRPAAFRLASFALHWADACLVFAFLRRRVDDRAAAAAALLFAIFPAHAEVLAVSTFKKHLLVSFFGLGVLVFAQPRGAAVLGAALLALALLTKESALAIPLLAAVADAGPGWKERARAKARFWTGQAATVAAFLAWRLFFLPVEGRPLAGGGWALHALTSAKGFLWYWRTGVLPWPLCPESDLRPVASLWSAQTAAILLGLAALLVLCARVWRRDRVAGAGLLWFGAALAPFQNIPPSLNLSLVADRYLYLASAGLIWAAARWSAGLRPRARAAAFAVVALGWSALSMRQAALYASPEDLWRRAAECAPGNPRSHTELAAALAAEGRLDEASAELRLALARSPDWYRPTAALLLADVYSRQGRSGDALALARVAAEAEPTQSSLAELGVLELRAGDVSSARRSLEEALRLDPRQGEALLALGSIRRSQGRAADAEALWARASALGVYRARALVELGRLRLAQGRTDEARLCFEQAAAADPDDPSAVGGLADALAREGRRAEGLAAYDALIGRLERAGRALPAGPEADALRARLTRGVEDARAARRSLAR